MNTKKLLSVDLKKIKDFYGISWKELGKRIGKSDRAIYSYLSEERTMPKSCALLVRRVFNEFFEKQNKNEKNKK